VRNLLRKFLRLPAPDRRLLLEAAMLQAAVRLALWFLPVRTWHRPSACVGIPDTVSPARAAWAIATTTRLIPRSTCLVRALAAQRLLARHGYPSTLHLGVAKSPEFEAHAWLECQGAILIGAAAPGHYATIYSAVGASAPARSALR
jgi:hypothetical protein